MEKQICTKCNGAGEITRARANMTPECNVAMCNAVTMDNGERFPFTAGVTFVGGGAVYYHHPCTCKDGFIEWTRGMSLTPICTIVQLNPHFVQNQTV